MPRKSTRTTPANLADKRPRKKRQVELYDRFEMRGQVWENPLTFGVEVSTMPPSANAMYDDVVVVRGGKRSWTRVLSDSAKNWRAAFKREFFKVFGHTLHKVNDLVESDRFECFLVLCSPVIVSKGFPKEAKTLFREIDVDNRIKFAQDTFFGALGLNDKISFHLDIRKHYHPTDEKITMHIRQTQEMFGLTPEILAKGANTKLYNPPPAAFREKGKDDDS